LRLGTTGAGETAYGVEGRNSLRGAKVPGEGTVRGLPPTGKRVTLPGITTLRFAGGRCVGRWSQSDFLGLLQQLGATPSGGASA
jgi:hypothetical protein